MRTLFVIAFLSVLFQHSSTFSEPPRARAYFQRDNWGWHLCTELRMRQGATQRQAEASCSRTSMEDI